MSSSSNEDTETSRFAGTEVHVHKEGRLFCKSSFLCKKRPVEVQIKGTTLTTSHGQFKKWRLFDLNGATLLKNESQRRIVLQLASKESLSFYAANDRDFHDWVETFADSMQWKVQRFYDIGKEIGRGAYAMVRKGKHKATGDVVAVKVISKNNRSKEDLKYMQREVDISVTLRHGNIVQTTDLFESENKLYIVMEYMPGGNLQEFVDQNGPLGENGARHVMRDILSAVEYIHANGVVHRDIKVRRFTCEYA